MQAKILTVTDAQNAFAEEACEALMKQGIRAEVDTRNEKLGFKVREAQLAKIPYILVVGDKEVEARSVNVRLRTGENLGVKSLDEVAALVQEELRGTVQTWRDELSLLLMQSLVGMYPKTACAGTNRFVPVNCGYSAPKGNSLGILGL